LYSLYACPLPGLRHVDERHEAEAAARGLEESRQNVVFVEEGVQTDCTATLCLDNADAVCDEADSKLLKWVPLMNGREEQEVEQQARSVAKSEQEKGWR